MHDALRRLAAKTNRVVELLAREALAKLVQPEQQGGIDRAALRQAHAALGIDPRDWPEWGPEMDDPAFSRQVLGLDDVARAVD